MTTSSKLKTLNYFKGLDELIGKTPLLEIRHSRSNKVKIFAKCEWVNPSGSIKDRVAISIFKDALEKDLLLNKILIDATSGNTGVSLSMLGAVFQIPVELVIPENASLQNKLMIQNYGAKLHFTSPENGTDGAQWYLKNLINEYPEIYYHPNQYSNCNNWKAHFNTTAPEIWSQTNNKITHFISGLGTSGTFVGVSKFLKEKNVKCVAVHPDSRNHGLQGWKYFKTEMIPSIYDNYIADKHVEVSTKTAYSFAKSAFCHLGLSLSPSSAGNLAAALNLSKELNDGVIVTIFPDNASKYLQDIFWKDDNIKTENPFF